MKGSARVSVWLGIVLGIGCASTEPLPKPQSEASSAEPQPQSAEWLYATEQISGGRKAECNAIPARIAEEAARCKGALCAHGAALARDWLRTCKSLAPALRTEVTQARDALAEKADDPAKPCEEEAERVLHDAACPDKSCKSFETWGTRCAEWSTPLVIRMLETTIERRTGNRIRIDARGCSELLGEATKGIWCEQQFKCQDALPAVDTYRTRCLTGGQLPSFETAIGELSIRVGARQDPKPLAVAAASGTEPAANALLALDAGDGAVLFVCDKRVRDLKSYLEARKGCEEQIVIVRRFADKAGLVVRVGHLPHPNDATFSRRFPSLFVKGESEARAAAALPGFVSALTDAARRASDPKQSQEAIRTLLAALASHLGSLRDAETFDAALRSQDAQLVPLFDAIGKAKKKAIAADFDAKKFAPVLYRAQSLPLADIGADGRVKLGQSLPAASFELVDKLPQSMQAYRSELEPRFKKLEKAKIKDRDLDKLASDANANAVLCAKAYAKADSAEQSLIACGFRIESCDDARVKSTSTDLDQARTEAENTYAATQIAIASLSADRRANAKQAATLAGCREP